MYYHLPGVSSCLFILLFLCSASLNAQDRNDGRYTFDFRGETLTEVLELVAQEAEIDMVYDPAIVNDISVYKRIKDQPVRETLKLILADTPLDFITLSSGTIVIVLTVNEAPAYGSYFGKVADRETGEPLTGATVMLADASGGTSTSSTGTFALNKLVSGSYTIVFSYVGYEPVYKTIEIHPNQNLQDKVYLNPKPVDVIPIVVTGHLPQMPNHGSNGQSVEPLSQWEAGGKIKDAIRSLSLFPGVQYGLPMTDLHLQGSQKGEHRILLDGVPIYNPHSFGRMFSAFSPYAISKIRLHKAGYGVPEGSQIAGLVDMTHDIHSVNENGMMFQGDPLSLNFRGNLIVPRSEDTSLKVMTAVRSNYWDLYREPRLDQALREWDNLDPLITNLLIDSNTDASYYQPREHSSDVRFYDLHLASRYEVDSYSTLSSSFYLGKNFVSTDLLRQAPPDGDMPQYLYARDEYSWNNFMGQLTYNKLISPRLDLSSKLSFTSNRLRHRYLIGTNHNPVIPILNRHSEAVYNSFVSDQVQSSIPTQKSSNRIQHLILRTDATYSFTPRFNLKSGFQLDYVKSSVNLSDLFYLPTLSDQRSVFVSGYADGNWTLGKYWKLNIGNRFTLDNSSTRFYLEPRTAIQFDQPQSNIGYWSVRLSGGLYRQFINQYDITNPGPTSLVPSFPVWSHAGASQKPKAWHFSGSFHLEPHENTTLNFEAFYKWQPTSYTISYGNLIAGYSVDRSAFDAFAETTQLNTFGAGVRLNRSIAESQVLLMVGYDYSRSKIDLNSQFGRALPAPWNEPHRFQLRALWHALPKLTAVAKWQSVLGRIWGFRQAYYNFLFYEYGPSIGNHTFISPEDDRLSPFHQYDLSFIYKPSIKFMNLEVRLDLVNLLNRRNVIDWSLQPDTKTEGKYEVKERMMPGFSPSFSIQLYF